jgi:hypothetical protein
MGANQCFYNPEGCFGDRAFKIPVPIGLLSKGVSAWVIPYPAVRSGLKSCTNRVESGVIVHVMSNVLGSNRTDFQTRRTPRPSKGQRVDSVRAHTFDEREFGHEGRELDEAFVDKAFDMDGKAG